MSELGTLVWGAKDWAGVAAGAGLILLVLLVMGYVHVGASRSVRFTAATLKALGILILLLCLLDPLFTGDRARPGANQFVVLSDNSQSMTLKDASDKTRGDELKAAAGKSSSWLAQLGRDFDLRQYAFDSQLRTVDEMDTLAFNGSASDLGAALDRLLRRYQGRPLAGILLLTDGGATDADALESLLARAGKSAADKSTLPPIYPVVFGQSILPKDISLERLDITQTNFEDAPVTIGAYIHTHGEKGQTLVADLLDDSGHSVQQQKVQVDEDGKPLIARFKVKPERPGISFYSVRVAAANEITQFTDPEKTTEATLANNTRIAVVDRGQGPYRVLYVAGRPTWEYKFMERSLITDDQVELVGLVRVAKREPKFNFSSRPGDRSNPIYGEFAHADTQPVEEYDQPVIMRFGTADQAELHAGFPKTADELFKYHAIILDNVESDFFSVDQLQLVKDFVRQRGGGLLMLGGEEAFKNGKFDRTPIGDILPVYCDQVQEFPVDAKFRISLTKEGWLEPWLRLRADEASEKARLDMMPAFESLNPVRGIKPGATILARATAEDGTSAPALVEQRFGQGRTGALLVGDMWRWLMNRPANSDAELEKSWRQTIRWLVGEVPKRVEMAIDPRHEPDDADGTLRLAVQVRDAVYAPLDNAVVNVRITAPDKKTVEMRAVPSANQPGRYEVTYVPRAPGAYLAQAAAEAPDGSDVGIAQAGWASDPAAEEFRDLQPNTALLERLAQATGGEVVSAADLARFAASLPTRKAQITESYSLPLWHQSWVFLVAIACLAAEWGLRRWKGLP